ncbi:MAG: hypothetical protein NTX16_11640 [Actinobacteria bacterium]|nr:hypothetical protein [Actinomycetota bacterium]
MSDELRESGAPTDEERARAFREQLKSLHAFDLAYDMMIGLVSFGYQKMGLTDETSELRDLGDARLAIELLRANLEVVEREQGGERTRDVRSTLAQMQLGFAQAVSLAGAAPAARPPAAEAATDEPATDEPAANEAVAEDAVAKQAPPRKPAAEKPAAGKPAAGKPAAGKPAAAKKTAPKKAAAKKPRGGATPPAG